MRAALPPLAALLLLAGCASPPPRIVIVTSPAANDRLYRPARVEPGRLEYAPDQSTFPPLLTERVAYPTQPQANDAYYRLLASAPLDLRATSVRLFGLQAGRDRRADGARGPLPRPRRPLRDRFP